MTETAPRVTVGIPVFNGQKWLAETVESVIKQSLEDLVIIISDNASTDESWKMALELASRDERILCYRNSSNVGVFRNLDRVFELAATPYFKWCAVGDLIEESFLERAVDVLEREKDVTLVYSKTRLFGSLAEGATVRDMDVSLDTADPVSRYRTYLSAAGLNSPFHGVIRSQSLSKTSLNKCFRGSDQCLVAALLLYGRFVRLPEELLYRRIESDTATATKTPQELDEFFGAEAGSVNQMPTWKREKQLFRDLVRAPMGARTKLKIASYLFRRLIWSRQNLASEARLLLGRS